MPGMPTKGCKNLREKGKKSVAFLRKIGGRKSAYPLHRQPFYPSTASKYLYSTYFFCWITFELQSKLAEALSNPKYKEAINFDKIG
jgi:hypothetical protein